jgi:hypothetical protein
MMDRSLSVSIALVWAALVVSGCSEKREPAIQAAPPAPAAEMAAAIEASPAQNDPNTTRAKLDALGIPTHYAARFDGNTLMSIEEQRQPPGGTAVDGEYFFEGARLIRYRGAKVSQPGQLDLAFDMQGSLQSGAGPGVTQDEVVAIRDRAQLLRSHAMAQRSSRGHSRQ